MLATMLEGQKRSLHIYIILFDEATSLLLEGPTNPNRER